MIDTNVVLDLFVFGDGAAQPLRAALADGQLAWLATAAMRGELERVLGYPQIAVRLAARGGAPGDVLAAFDAGARTVAAAAKAPVTCRDADDQKFVDLAVAHGAWLLSKDRAVLALAKRLQRLGIGVSRQLPDPS